MSRTILDPTKPIHGIANPNVIAYNRFRVLSHGRSRHVVWDYKLNRIVMDAETGFPMVFTHKWEAERVTYVMTARILMLSRKPLCNLHTITECD